MADREEPEAEATEAADELPGIREVNKSPETPQTQDELAEVPELDEKSALTAAAESTDKKVKVYDENKNYQTTELHKLQGCIGEELAIHNMPESINLNDSTGNPCFPGYDITSPYEFASVKTFTPREDGSLRLGSYAKHLRDISNPDASTNQLAAGELLKLQSESPEQWQQLVPHLPPGVAEARDQQQMATALVNSSCLRISGDQVAEVREHLKQQIMTSPADYGLDPTVSEVTLADQGQRLVRDRVRPIDKNFTSKDIREAAQDIQQQRHSATYHRSTNIEHEIKKETEPISLGRLEKGKPIPATVWRRGGPEG